MLITLNIAPEGAAALVDGLSDHPRPPSLGMVIAALRREKSRLEGMGAAHIAVFGSVARGEEGPGSDVDLLVKIGEDVDAFALAALTDALRDLLGVKVDVVTLNEFRRSMNRSAEKDVIVAY